MPIPITVFRTSARRGPARKMPPHQIPSQRGKATTSSGRVWTVQAVNALGTTTDVETAGQILGISRTKAYQLAKDDQFPVPVLRIGRRYIVPVAPLLRTLGAEVT